MSDCTISAVVKKTVDEEHGQGKTIEDYVSPTYRGQQIQSNFWSGS